MTPLLPISPVEHVTHAPVDFTFEFGWNAAINLPLLTCTFVGGFLLGSILGRLLDHYHVYVSISTICVFIALVLLTLQLVTIIGVSIYAPNNSPAFLGGHLGYVVLSLWLAFWSAPAMWFSTTASWKAGIIYSHDATVDRESS